MIKLKVISIIALSILIILSPSTASAASNASVSNTLNLSMGMLQADLSTGKLISSVPIPLPQSRAGMSPKIELWYRNNTDNHSNTWCGVGWVLDMGYIQRSTKNGLPAYTDSDTFILSVNNIGSELIPVGAGEYRLKSGGESLKVVKTGGYWQVFDSGGKQYIFGQSQSAQTAYAGNTFSWHLEKVIDIHGNFISLLIK